MTLLANCPLCCLPKNDEFVIYSNELYLITLVDEDHYLGYVRLILKDHIKEMTDLDQVQALEVFKALLIIEQSMLDNLDPDKINVASLGNIVPHLHWHIIPRFKLDKHFPNSIWGSVTNNNYRPDKHLVNQIPNFIMDLKQHLLLHNKDNDQS